MKTFGMILGLISSISASAQIFGGRGGFLNTSDGTLYGDVRNATMSDQDRFRDNFLRTMGVSREDRDRARLGLTVGVSGNSGSYPSSGSAVSSENKSSSRTTEEQTRPGNFASGTMPKTFGVPSESVGAGYMGKYVRDRILNELMTPTATVGSLQVGRVWNCTFLPVKNFQNHDASGAYPLDKFVPTYRLKELTEGWFENEGTRSVPAFVRLPGAIRQYVSENNQHTFADFITVGTDGSLYGESTVSVNAIQKMFADAELQQKILQTGSRSAFDHNRVVIGYQFCPLTKVTEKSPSIDLLAKLESFEEVKDLLRVEAPMTEAKRIPLAKECQLEILPTNSRAVTTYSGEMTSTRRRHQREIRSFNILVRGVRYASADELFYDYSESKSYDVYSGGSFTIRRGFLGLGRAITVYSPPSYILKSYHQTYYLKNKFQKSSGYTSDTWSRESQTTKILSDGLSDQELHLLNSIQTLLRAGFCEDV